MSEAEKLATQDIISEMTRENSHCFVTKSFIEFRQYLNPVMECLVQQQLEAQEHLKHNSMEGLNKSRRQIVASCFVAKSGELKVVRFDKYVRYASNSGNSPKYNY